MRHGCFMALLLLGFVSGCAHGPRSNPWRDALRPAPAAADGISKVFGGYAAGCVQGAVSLTPDGPGYQVMRLGRGRYYGHPNLVAYVKELGASVHKAKLGVLLIGDLGQPRGGPTLTAHRSHQSGLDVDIWYFRLPLADRKACNGMRSLSLDERDTLESPSVVMPDRLSVNPAQWSDSDAKVLKLAAHSEEVERIFVNPAVKKALCSWEKGSREWLHKLRPWWGHADHFHVRLRCPQGAGQEGCKAQEAVDPGDGCDQTLEEWFTAEMLEKAKAQEDAGPSPMPDLPQSCQDVLKL